MKNRYERDQNKSIWKGFDWFTVICITLLVFIGVLFIANATANPFTGQEQGFREIWNNLNLRYPLLHILWFVTGLALLVLFSVIDYQVYADLTNIAYIVLVIMLALLLIAAQATRGITGWIKFGERSIQPAELFKIVLILIMAKYASKAMEKDGRATLNLPFLKMLAQVGIPTFLVIRQPDWGTALVYLFIVAVVLFAAKLSWKVILPIIFLAITAVAVLFFTGKMEPYQIARILNFLSIDDPETLGALGVKEEDMNKYDNSQGEAAQIAIGSGGMYGKGFFQPGSFVKLDYLAEGYTDFAFASGIEAVGWVGGIVILLLYALLIGRALMIAYSSKDYLGTFIVLGVVAMLLAHIIENIGMNLGLMPITGIPLPFISYGGSSMWTNMIAFGLVINVNMHKPGKRYKRSYISDLPTG